MELCKEWEAWHNRMPGATPMLRVTGTCCFDEGGWTVTLERHNPPGANPRALILDLVATRGDGGTTALTEVPVHWEDVQEAELDQVDIVVPGATEPKVLRVQIAE